MIAPALAPATFVQVVIGFVGCSAKPHSAPASASPLTPPPRKTPSASVIHSIGAVLVTVAMRPPSSGGAAGCRWLPRLLPCDPPARTAIGGSRILRSSDVRGGDASVRSVRRLRREHRRSHVTELTQPLAATGARAPSTTPESPTAAAHTVSFSELVYAHLDWWRQRQDHGLVAPTSTGYDEALRAFQQRHGQIIGCYWCTQIESGVALTERRRLGGWLQPVYSFHRESDWATHNAPDVAAELHRCDELAVRAKTVLTGVRQRICMQLVMSSAAHLLSLVDTRARHANDGDTDIALERERAAITKTENYYHEAANGQAQMVYFGGMASVTVALAIIAAVWLTYDWASPLAALIAGAVGAV